MRIIVELHTDGQDDPAIERTAKAVIEAALLGKTLLSRDGDRVVWVSGLTVTLHRPRTVEEELRHQATLALDSLAALRPEVEATPSDVELMPAMLTRAVSASRSITLVKHDVDRIDSDEARALSAELLEAQKWLKAQKLPHGMDA